MKINGKWYFNEVLYFEGEIIQEINGVLGNDSSSVFTYLEYDLVNFYANNESLYEDGSKTWANEAYRTIDFGAAYQEVSDDFYTWLTANAKQISKPIPMTHPKGIRLLTKGHKLSKDLEVVPTFMETVTVTFEDSLGTGVTMFCTVLENGVISGRAFQTIDTTWTVTVNNVLKNSLVALAVTRPWESSGEGWTADGEYEYLNPEDSLNHVGYIVKGDITIQTAH